MGEQGGSSKEQLRKRILPLIVKELQKGATPESIIPRVVKSGLTKEDALELVNIAIDEAGSIMAPPEAPAPRSPYETPAAQVRPNAPADGQAFGTSAPINYSGMYATFIDKLVATFIDGIILMVIMVPIFFLIGMEMAMGGQKTPSASGSFFTSALGIIIPLIYFAVLEGGSRHATFGKRVMNLMVVGTDGGEVSIVRAGLRNLVSQVSGIILMLGYLVSIVSAKNQTLHDLICGTVVIKTS